MPSMTFVGKHSKDKYVSVYLVKRVFIDEGEGVEPITGIVKVDPKKAVTLPADEGVFVAIHCYFVYEYSDFDVDVVDYTLYERDVQVYPKSENIPQYKSPKVTLPEFHFPFEFRLPLGLPPSITLNSGFVYFGRPIGISYEVNFSYCFEMKKKKL